MTTPKIAATEDDREAWWLRQLNDAYKEVASLKDQVQMLRELREYDKAEISRLKLR